MAGELEQIRTLLSEQRLSEAVRATLDWFGGSEPMVLAGTLGGSLRAVIDAGQTQTVSAFLTQLRSFVDMPVIEAIRKALDEARADAGDWGLRLLPVTQERLAREIRDALRLRTYDLALQRSRQLLGLRVGEQSIGQRCQLLGAVLGSLENIPHEVDTLWGQLEHRWGDWKLPEELKRTVITARQARLQSIYQRRYDVGESEWTRQLTELAVSLKGELARPNQLGAPSAEEIDRFLAAARGLVKGAFASPQRISVPDALWVLVEYTPREQTSTADRAGIEQRVHATLGPRAQQATAEAFRRLADIEPLREAVLDTGLRPPFDRYRDLALELMAAMEWPGFTDCALGILKDKRKIAHHPAAINAVGACGGEQSLDMLFDLFREATRGRVVDGAERRQAEKALNAMGRVIRRHAITLQPRDALLDKIIKLVPARDTRLNLYIASRLCLTRPQDLAPRHLDWAARRFLEGLARPDQTPTFARPTDVEEIRKKPLGQRQGFVNALVLIGESTLPMVHDFIMSEASRVSGATLALNEVLSRIASPTSVGPLEQLLRTVLMTPDDDLRGAYTEEMVFDPEAGHMVPLDRDALVAAITAALRKIGTPEALEVLHRLRQQIESRQIPPFGKQTAAVLTDLPLPPSRGKGPGDGGERPSTLDSRPSTLDPRPLIADLAPGGFLGLGAAKARPRRIAALQALSQRLIPEAMEPIMNLLGDKDPLVRASAKTALLAYASPSAPPNLQERFADCALAELGDGKSKIRDGLLEFLGQVNTTVEPWASRLDALMKTEPTGAMRAALARLRRSAGQTFTAVKQPPLLLNPSAEAEGAPAASRAGPTPAELLTLKRQYLDARRAWIADGKRGPAPQPPEGLDL